jgi:hypothetical protein
MTVATAWQELGLNGPEVLATPNPLRTITRAWKQLAKKLHPDKRPLEEAEQATVEMRKLNDARDTLERELHDQ